ncbi:MAG: septal ring lytic transglycosylase RlpA family protein [Aestuariivirga sp.]
MRMSLIGKFATLLCAVFLAGCGATDSGYHHGYKNAKLDPFAGTGSPYYRGGGKIPFGGGRYQVGEPYQVGGRWFTPREQPGYDRTGTASWYGEAFHRRRTSNGEYFDMNTLTAAHATLPLPSYVLVTNLENNRNVVVRVNDRGPFVNTRVIDVSKRAADELGYRLKGTAKVRVQYLGPAPLNDHGEHLMAMNSALSTGARKNDLVALAQNPKLRGPNSIQVAAAKREPTPIAEVQMADADPSLEPQQNEDLAPALEPAPVQAYIVRVAVFHSLENANTAYQQLAGFGPTQIVRAVGANGPLYRVQIGPLDNASDAQSALDSAAATGYEGARIVETQSTQVSLN